MMDGAYYMEIIEGICFSLPEIWDWDRGSPSSRTMIF
jgi:hypothetical protein